MVKPHIALHGIGNITFLVQPFTNRQQQYRTLPGHPKATLPFGLSRCFSKARQDIYVAAIGEERMLGMCSYIWASYGSVFIIFLVLGPCDALG
jgi:hypothetical protein